MRNLDEALFPPEIRTLLKTLSKAGFFERSLLIGSWVMLIYRELYGVTYALRTMDVDFAVHVARPRTRLRADLERLITGAGFSSFFGAEGLQKFSAGGYEVEFIVHRQGGKAGGVRSLEEWKLNRCRSRSSTSSSTSPRPRFLAPRGCGSRFPNPSSSTSSSSLPEGLSPPSGSRTWSSALLSSPFFAT